jgi:hypothetical protein
MTPRAYWLGWLLMGVGFLAVVGAAAWYLGGKLDAIVALLERR